LVTDNLILRERVAGEIWFKIKMSEMLVILGLERLIDCRGARSIRRKAFGDFGSCFLVSCANIDRVSRNRTMKTKYHLGFPFPQLQ
jgi:hypothetical protein